MSISVTRDDVRVEAIQRSLDANDLKALVCALPNNVLLILESGDFVMVHCDLVVTD